MHARVFSLALILSFARLLSVQADNDEWLIVPGKSIGQISIGMPQAEVFKLLGTPAMQNDFEETDRSLVYIGKREGAVPVAKGVTQSDWTTRLPVPQDLVNVDNYLCDFLTVYVRDTRVVQIEIRVPRFRTADGLSIRNTGKEWRKHFPHTEIFDCKCHQPSTGGIPATKRFVSFEDAVNDGIAWRCGGFGNLAPDVGTDGVLDTVIVHAPGANLLPDPDGGCRFTWKDRPNRRSGD